MGQTCNSVGYSIKRKVDELRSTYDVIVSYSEWNSKKKKWETPHLKFTFDKSYQYSGKEIKQLISKKMNMDEDELVVASDAWFHLMPLRDDANYQYRRLQVTHNIQFNVKYFYTDTLD